MYLNASYIYKQITVYVYNYLLLQVCFHIATKRRPDRKHNFNLNSELLLILPLDSKFIQFQN